MQKLVDAQRDLLTPQAIDAIAGATGEVRALVVNGRGRDVVLDRMTHLEAVANKWLKPYPFTAVRENVDVVLVALVVALGFRTFFLQPMAIPTGSMQPTLYGITEQDLRKQPEVEIPNPVVRIWDSVARGISYYHVTALADGEFQGFGPVETIFPFVKRQRLFVSNQRPYSVLFPPDKIEERTGLRKGDSFRKGDDIVKLKLVSGDRLFVDRVTYNFRRPLRGEIIIFVTQGIKGLQQDTHYIKRLVGLGEDTVQIGDDRHLIVNGRRLDASRPGFENIYSFHGPPEANHYSGHTQLGVEAFRGSSLVPKFCSQTDVFTVRPNHYLVMGDNTMNSYDSRFWGDFPREKVVGKCAFVFWPITGRFGWGFR